MTGEQFRAAIGVLRWSRRDVSEKTKVPARTVQRIAEASGVPNTQAPTLAKIVEVLKEAGVDMAEVDGCPAVIIRSEALALREDEESVKI